MEFTTKMKSKGYDLADVQVFDKTRVLDYEDEDGDEWEFSAHGLAARGGETRFHVLTTFGFVAEINGNRVSFYDEDDGLRAAFDLGVMGPGQSPISVEQRYMRALCHGDEVEVIEEQEGRLLWRARRELLSWLQEQCLLHTLRFEKDGRQLVLVLQAQGTHTICQMAPRFDVRPLVRSPLADPGDFYEVIVATSPGMTMEEAEEILVTEAPSEKLFGGVVEEETPSTHDGHLN